MSIEGINMQNSRYFLGIDNGGSTTTCAIFDSRGRLAAVAGTRIPMYRDAQGCTEREADDIFAGSARVIREAIEKAGIDPEEIACVSMCGYGGGLGMLDEAGRPVGRFIVSTDSRADGLLGALEHDGTTEKVYAHTCQNLWAGQPATLLK